MLEIKSKKFYMDSKPFDIYSGAMHYFRTVPEYWEDRLTKLKAAGFNTVETYVCWNLHEKKPGEFDFSRDYIIKSVDGILDRLNTDYLDSLLLHRPDALMEPQEVAEAFDYLMDSGKVRNFGVSNHNTMQIELLKTAVKQPISINQMQFSIAHCPMITAPLNVNMKNDESFMHSDPVIEYSRINGILLQAWSPFRGDYNKSTFLGDYERYGELNNKLDEIAQRYSVTSQAIASAWILRHPAGIQLISGSMNPDRIVEVCNGAGVSLTRKEWYEIYLSAGYNLP